MLIHVDVPSAQKVRQSRFEVIFSLGFRPLYLLGALWAMVSVGIWIYAPQLLTGTLNGMLWHAHEMIWGFVATIAVAFLLTASATWTGSNPLKGRGLAFLVVLYLTSRIGFLVPGLSGFYMAAIAQLAFFLIAAFCVARVLLKAKSKQNYPLIGALVALAIADAMYLSAVYFSHYEFIAKGLLMGILVMVLVALMIARRVTPFFASRALGIDLNRHEKSGLYQLLLSVLVLLLLFFGWSKIATMVMLIIAAISLKQLYDWHPMATRRVPILWVLYLSYFFLALGLIAAALFFLEIKLLSPQRSAMYFHLIGMGGFALMIMGMITRTALGHTGRAIKAGKCMVLMYVLIVLATMVRLAAFIPGTPVLPLWHSAAALWILAFALYLWQFVPILLSPRADGRPS